ncbi:hypothetical protein QBC37DRAFT_439348 [Rhypophila decipiens]|uniref:Atos-like conserved domain-containing protein n=1 Tax=Rhypophila decipiens TaxID=261697 RepID=A0AAN6YBM7_9PEZI|nr:hypothetical protein QBC37DRAFT_439348 [Rhypophila decipiens]
MPIFRASREPPGISSDDYRDAASPIPIQTPPDSIRPLTHRLSEESIRTEFCEGPIPDSPPKPVTPERTSNKVVSDRAELIECLKRGESPTWIPNRHLESLFNQGRSPPQTPTGPKPALLPAPDITPEKQTGCEDPLADSRLEQGLHIERPRSALHSGNFTPDEPGEGAERVVEAARGDVGNELTSAGSRWNATSPPRDFSFLQYGKGANGYRKEAFGSGISSISTSPSSSFVYKPPTSPLVQSESNEDLDLSLPLNSINIASNTPRNSRRHTLNSSGPSPYTNFSSHHHTPLRRESSHPYQAHQPRRSLNLSSNFAAAGFSAQPSAYLRPRRPSLSSDASPLQHASMVGSYEESILRGRMSTTPSKPLDFMAQIGVLGLGKCKPSLRCPAHVTLPFSAVFYSYASTSYGRSKVEDGPSPYVGQIDLENGLLNPDEEQRSKRKLQSRYNDRKNSDDDPEMQDNPPDLSESESRRTGKHKRQTRSPRAPPGGRYRIPEKGQLQIIIKNQNKTAVKLFLIPYDLAGMEAGSKTFIRQRSYSTGPIIDNIPELKEADTISDRPILRYLIHLHICCPSKGRFYLYKSIRVVFANRVPDGKEKLRNEVTYPEPRFTPYKPTRGMPTGPNSSSSLAAEQAFRRRSSGFSFADYSRFDSMDGIASLPNHAMPTPLQASFGGAYHGNVSVDPELFEDQPNKRLRGDNTLTVANNQAAVQPDNAPVEELSDSWKIWKEEMRDVEMAASPSHRDKYGKLNRGDVGYGGNAFAPAPSGRHIAPEGLLSQRLRSLGMQGKQVGEERERYCVPVEVR